MESRRTHTKAPWEAQVEAAHALPLYNFVVPLVVIETFTKENLTKRNVMAPTLFRPLSSYDNLGLSELSYLV